MMIKGVNGMAVAPLGRGRAGPGAPGFAVKDGGGSTAGPSGVAAAAALDGLLLLQEVEEGPSRDRRARKHGRVLLDALAKLQVALLDGEPDAESLARLAAMVEHCPEADDPGLRDLLGAVALRARVELARRKL